MGSFQKLVLKRIMGDVVWYLQLSKYEWGQREGKENRISDLYLFGGSSLSFGEGKNSAIFLLAMRQMINLALSFYIL